MALTVFEAKAVSKCENLIFRLGPKAAPRGAKVNRPFWNLIGQSTNTPAELKPSRRVNPVAILDE